MEAVTRLVLSPPQGVAGSRNAQKSVGVPTGSGGNPDLRHELRGQDLNLRPSGYEPDELPGCSTPRDVGHPYVTSPHLVKEGNRDHILTKGELHLRQ
jgi:hypothetical protein